MENGVSGGNIRHVGWKHNEHDEMGKRATGGTSSGAKGSEPIIDGGETTAGNGKSAAQRGCDKSVSIRPVDPPAVDGSALRFREFQSEFFFHYFN